MKPPFMFSSDTCPSGTRCKSFGLMGDCENDPSRICYRLPQFVKGNLRITIFKQWRFLWGECLDAIFLRLLVRVL